jgi:hypothetical protein
MEEDIPDARRFEFEEPDSDQTILFKENSKDFIPQIRGATLEKLIQRLTYEKYPGNAIFCYTKLIYSDPDRLLNFLLTYRQISTPEEVFELLYLRFHTPRPANMDVEFFRKEKLNPIRIR